jgi:hypothetical protein
METIIIQFRNKRSFTTFQNNQRGIMLSWVGTDDKNYVNELTTVERNEILITIINN